MNANLISKKVLIKGREDYIKIKQYWKCDQNNLSLRTN